MARKKRLPVLFQYDLSDIISNKHQSLGEDSMVRKGHGDALVGDTPTAESFRQKVLAMERSDEKRVVMEVTAAPAAPPVPKLSPGDILRAAVYGDAIFSRPPGAAYFQRRKNGS